MRRRWLKRRRRRKRHDLLASGVLEGKMEAEGGVGMTVGASHHCHRGYCWEGWAGAVERHLKGRKIVND